MGAGQSAPFAVDRFDPLTLITLKYRGRSVAVYRSECFLHEVSHTNCMPRLVRA
jgi:hypothetical protein